MTDEINTLLQGALQQILAGAQDVGRAFRSRRSNRAIRHDLEGARDRLQNALNCVNDAINNIGN